MFAIAADDLALCGHRSGVVERGMAATDRWAVAWFDITDNDCGRAGLGGESFQGDNIVGHEPGLEHQVFGWVPGDCELRKDRNVAPGRFGFAQCSDREVGVVIEGTNNGVDLTQCNSQRRGVIHDRNRRARRVRRPQP